MDMGNSARVETQRIMRHEAFHQYLFYATGCGHHMTWFNEGHATFFECVQYNPKSDEVRIGDEGRWADGVARDVGHIASLVPGILQLGHDEWKAEKMHTAFINYDMLEEYRDFGGIRIEDDILITEGGCRVLGKDIIPYHPDDVEAFMAQ